MTAQLHPILSQSATDRVPLRRPRFTMSEVLLLNVLVNSTPSAVPLSRLRRVLQSYSSRLYGVTEDAVRQHMVNLRAKLGEASRAPTLIVTCHIDNSRGGVELAYLYRDPEEN